MKLLPKRKASNLSVLDLIAPWLLVGTLFYVLRQLEVWLHQHIFKVGWLVTKQYQTTTILYYAFFLPGIIINQFIFWLAAGFLNVSAERSIAWPQKQEIGELKLDFIRLSKNVTPFRLAIISTAPLLVGLFAVWFIANNVLNVATFLTEMNIGGPMVNLSTALGHFTAAPDFWIWVYFAFAISNTMMPNFANLRGWRIILTLASILIVALYILGAGDQVIMTNLRGPVTNALNSLSSVFAIIIGLDVFMVVVLGTLEAIIERVTGDSATFENGKMITLRRNELLARRQQALTVKPQPKTRRTVPETSGPPSVYKLQFPIPGAPGKEAVTPGPQIVISQETKPALPSQPDSRIGPAVISGTVTEKLPPPASPVPSNPVSPVSRPATGFSAPVPPPKSPLSVSTGTSPSPTPSGQEKPASPMGLAPRSPVNTAPMSAVKPAPKPISPFGSDDDHDEADDEIMDDEEQEVNPPAKPLSVVKSAATETANEEEDSDEDEGEVSYEDFEDPA